MRDMLHLCGLCCACPWACRDSNFFSPCVPFCRISCRADAKLLQVVVSGLVCIWACVTCCICVSCVALVLGLDAVPTFFLLASFLGDIMSRCYEFVASCCERFGLHLGMRGMLYLCGLCYACPWAGRGSNFFSPHVVFGGTHVSLISICCKLL